MQRKNRKKKRLNRFDRFHHLRESLFRRMKQECIAEGNGWPFDANNMKFIARISTALVKDYGCIAPKPRVNNSDIPF